MCGIAGVVDFKGRDADPARMDRAVAALAHRGPDDRGTWHSAGPPAVMLGNTRLAVIDPRPEGRMPLVAADGRSVITYNGEIYNHAELRAELSGCGVTLRTRTDTEVILAGFIHWGPAVFDRLEGMWACCIYDLARRRGVLCRDRFGIKPLLYCDFDGTLAFGSELRAVQILSDAPRDLDPPAVAHFMRFGYAPPASTPLCHVCALPPAHFVDFDAAGATGPRRYYDLAEHALATADAAPEHRVRAAVRSGVTRRTLADVPLGAFLSGGIDSSIVTCELSAVHRGVNTFAVGYRDEPRYDETRYAEAVAEACGTTHHTYRAGLDDVLNALPVVLDHISEPLADASLIPTWLVSQHARSRVTVALSGDGADELFGGYQRYRGHRALRHVPRWARGAVKQLLARHAPGSKSGAVQDRLRQLKKLLRTTASDPFVRHRMWSRILSPEAEALLDPGGVWTAERPASEVVRATVGDALWDRWHDDPLNVILIFDLLYQLPADMLRKVDNASMACGLEVRVPFLDRDIVELAVGLPSAVKMAGGRGKALLIDAYADRLPAEILRRRKMGFELPIGELLRGPLRDMFHDTVNRETVESLPGIDYAGVMTMYDAHCARKDDYADALFGVLVLCRWIGNQ